MELTDQLRERCQHCGSVNHPTTLCLYEEFEKQTVRMERRDRKDGITWMVSIIHPDHPGGSTFYSERAGKNAKEAALSYFNDPIEDSKGAALAHQDPEMTLIVVIDDEYLASSRKPWKVTIFMPQKKTDGSFDLIEFS